MCLVGNHNDVAAQRQDRVNLADLCTELLNQRKHILVIFLEQLSQMGRALCPGIAIRYRSRGSKLLVDLLI